MKNTITWLVYFSSFHSLSSRANNCVYFICFIEVKNEMGASESVTVRVSFNRSNGFYFGGEKLTGTVSFQNIQSKVTVEEILLELIGEFGYTTRETRWGRDTKGRSHREHYTEYHHVPFLTIPVSVFRSTKEQVRLFML